MTGHLEETPGSEKEELVRLQPLCQRKRTFMKIKNLLAWKRGTLCFLYQLLIQCPILFHSVSQAVPIMASCEWDIREEYNTKQAHDSCPHTAYNLMSKQIPYSPAFSPFLPPSLVLPYLLTSGFWSAPDPCPCVYLHTCSSLSHPVSWP